MTTMNEKSSLADVDQERILLGARARSDSGKRSPRVRAVKYTLLAAAFFFAFVCFGLNQAHLPLNRLFAPKCHKSAVDSAKHGKEHQLSKYSVDAAAPSLLRDFQVYPPVLTPVTTGLALTDGTSDPPAAGSAGAAKGCVATQVLMVHVFAYSYGAPFVGNYTPPTNCNYNRVTFNITMLSAGRQFDRLWIAYFGNTEIWRSSTAEPTQNGIVWTYIKDMSSYLSLFQQKQKLIFDLGNIVDSTYTGSFNATLTATFFNSVDTVEPADLILPVSTLQGGNNSASVFTYPSQNPEQSLTFPRNTQKAVFTIAATGQIDEEFWFGDALQSEVNTFGAGLLYGYSPFREVQLYIDGMLAGVVWPFPIIFTGGAVPGLWRPIVGIDAFDLRENEIDITPWLPLLCDGKPHSFQILVAGIADDGKGNGQITNAVGSYWLVTGKAFIWLDAAGKVTTGTAIQRTLPDPQIKLTSHITTNSTGANETLTYTVSVNRNVLVHSNITTSSGTKAVAWVQTLKYTSYNKITDYGYVQLTKQETAGLDIGTSGYARKISYPISLNTSYIVAPVTSDLTLSATVNRVQDIKIVGQPVFPTGLQSFGALPDGPTLQGSHLHTRQNGTAVYFANGANTYATTFGSTQQGMQFSGFKIAAQSGNSFPKQIGSSELYTREVLAVNATVVSDKESLLGKPIKSSSGTASNTPALLQVAPETPMRLIGRGRGGGA